MRFALSILAVALVMLFAHVFFLRFLPGGDAVTLRLSLERFLEGSPTSTAGLTGGTAPVGVPAVLPGGLTTTTFRGPTGQPTVRGPSGTPAEPLKL